MAERSEEIVRADPVPEVVVEQQPVVERIVEQPVVERVAAAPPTRIVRRWWRDAPAVVPTNDVLSTEYYRAPAFGHDLALAQFVRVMWFMVGLLEGLLALRFLLAIMGANPRNAFAALVYGLTGPFVAPFRTLFATPTADGSVVELYALVAMIVYFLAWWTIVKLVAVVTNRPVDA
jgi:uncharacterized protein YggT (Ycf19 family)